VGLPPVFGVAKSGPGPSPPGRELHADG
jgi:hypothetical protein